MGTHRITCDSALSPDERASIAAHAGAHRGIDSLPAWATFLRDAFAVDMATDPDIVAGFVEDSSHLAGSAQALARPRSERECAATLAACAAAGIPVTLSAGRSNLTGSATPAGGVVLSTVAMLEPGPRLDAPARTVRAPVGMILENLRTHVRDQSDGRLEFPVNPTSRADAAVGGALACNASGFTPGEVGAIRHWVEAVDLVLPDGWTVRASRGQYVSEGGRFILEADDAPRAWPVPRYARPAIKNAGGPMSAPDGHLDLVDLVVGSEGLFGLVTACTLRLQECPDDYLDLFFSLGDERRALAFHDYMSRTFPGGFGGLSAFEYFGVNCRTYMDHADRLFHGDDRVAIYLQVPVRGEELATAAERWLDLLMASDCDIDGDAVLLLDNDRDRAVFFEARHSMPANSLEVAHTRGSYTIMTDTVVPPAAFAEFLDFAHERISSRRLDYLSFGHIGDCHLHIMILPERAQIQAAAEAYDAIIAKSADLGGVYSGEHGTGKRKRRDFLRCYGPAAAAEVAACKAAVDPLMLLNRGNVIEL